VRWASVLPSQRIDRPSDQGSENSLSGGAKIPSSLVDVAEQVGLSLWKTRLMRSLPLRQFSPADPREFPEVLLAGKYNADRNFT